MQLDYISYSRSIAIFRFHFLQSSNDLKHLHFRGSRHIVLLNDNRYTLNLLSASRVLLMKRFLWWNKAEESLHCEKIVLIRKYDLWSNNSFQMIITKRWRLDSGMLNCSSKNCIFHLWARAGYCKFVAQKKYYVFLVIVEQLFLLNKYWKSSHERSKSLLPVKYGCLCLYAVHRKTQYSRCFGLNVLRVLLTKIVVRMKCEGSR